MRTAVVSSSANADAVLDAAGISDLFDLTVDGGDIARLGLARQAGARRLPRGGAAARRRAAPRRGGRGRAGGRRRRPRGRLRARDRRRPLGRPRDLRSARRRRRRRRPRGAGAHEPASTGDPTDAGCRPSPSPSLRVGVRGRQRLPRPARHARGGRARRTTPARSSTASTRRGRSSTPRTPTASRAPARRSSTRPTARSSACSSTRSRSTSRTAKMRRYERVLDMRTGVLQREVEFETARGQRLLRALDAGSPRSSTATSPHSYEVTALDSRRRGSRSPPSSSRTGRGETADDPRRGKGFAEKVLAPVERRARRHARRARAAHPQQRARARVRDGARRSTAPRTRRGVPPRATAPASSCSPTSSPASRCA